jgi:ADP-ribosylglycohydrolase
VKQGRDTLATTYPVVEESHFRGAAVVSQDPIDDDAEAKAFEAAGLELQALHEKYPREPRFTFMSPGSQTDDLGNVCPICLGRTPTSARYASYICDPCTKRAVDDRGQAIFFGNVNMFGGVQAKVNGEVRDTQSCTIDGHRVEVEEGRFGGIVYTAVGAKDRSADPSRDGNKLLHRVTGAVLGAAIGDALGYPTEFVRSFDELRRRFGPNGVEGFVMFQEEGTKRFAPYTDDTQLAEVVLVSLLDASKAGEDLDLAMARLALAVVKWSREPQGGHRAPGRACLAGAAQLEKGAHWSAAGAQDAGGCGSVMRAYPVGLVFHSDAVAREEWAVAQSRLTHGAPIALAACSAMAHATASALAGDGVAATVRILVENARQHDAGTAEMIAGAAASARSGEPKESVLQRLQGWAAHEAIAAATYVYVRHPDDFRVAVLEAANSPGDSDSIATLVGALVGARCGTNAIPAEWRRDVERTEELSSLAARTLAESGFTDWDAVDAEFAAVMAKFR